MLYLCREVENIKGSTKNKLFKAAGTIALIMALSKIFGLVRDIIIASAYGTNSDSIAFEVASRIPVSLFDFLIGGVITVTFIPIFNDIIVNKGKKEANEFASSFINFILTATLIICAVGFVFSDIIIDFFAPDLSENVKVLTETLYYTLLPLTIFASLAFLSVGILQSFGEYNIPALISLVSNVTVILYLLFFNNKFGVFGLAIATLLGWAAQFLIQLPKLKKFGFKYSFSLKFNSPYLKRAFMAGLPILIGSWAQPVCTLINTRFASYIEGGRAITAFNYANRLYVIIVGIFSFVVTGLLFPYLSKAWAKGEKEEAQNLSRGALKGLLFIILPISAGVFVISDTIISVIYQNGSFNESDALLTAEALKYFAFGMPFMAINEVLTKTFFSQNLTRPPMIASIAATVFNLIFVIILPDSLGIAKISLACTVSIFINAILNYILLLKIQPIFKRPDFMQLLVSLVSSALMAFVVHLISEALSLGKYLSLIISVLSGALIYFSLLFIFSNKRIKEWLEF